MAIFQFNNCTIRPQTCQYVKSFIKGRKLEFCIITGINADIYFFYLEHCGFSFYHRVSLGLFQASKISDSSSQFVTE